MLCGFVRNPINTRIDPLNIDVERILVNFFFRFEIVILGFQICSRTKASRAIKLRNRDQKTSNELEKPASKRQPTRSKGFEI